MPIPTHRCEASWLRKVRQHVLGALLLALLTAGRVAGQPPDDNFFPFPSAAESFDPRAVLSAADDAVTRRPDAVAFAGLAEALQVDLLTGEATGLVPIELPPGRKAMTPELALHYKSRASNGLVGRGWDLRIPCVKRSTRRGVPLDWTQPPFPYPYFDDYVVILPSGSVLLDRYLGNSGAVFYFGSSAEELMLRAGLDTLNNTWTITTKSGTSYTFGAGPAATRTGNNVASLVSTFSWGVTQISDPSGNTISYSYQTYGLSGAGNAALYPWRFRKFCPVFSGKFVRS